MRRITTMMLVVAMVLSLAACVGSKAGDKSVGETPLEILSNVWDSYSDSEKFPIMGGGPEFDQSVMDGAGEFATTDGEAIDSLLGFPSSSIALVKEAASIMHAMNQNTFTAGAYYVSNSGDVEMLISDLEDNIMSRQWMCGFPDTLIIVKVDANTLVSAFGEATNIENFKNRILDVYSVAEVVSEQSLVQ